MRSERPRVLEIGPVLRLRHGRPVRRIGLRLGASCPNRDGTVGRGGCLYCAEPAEAGPATPLVEQLDSALRRLRHGEAGIAYLQDHTATHVPAGRLAAALGTLRSCPRLVGVAIGTRPDAIGADVLEVLAEHGRESPGLDLLVELGLQSADQEVLRFARRSHDVACFGDAVRRLHAAGARVGAHVILGLPRPGPGGDLQPEGPEGAAAAARLLGRLGVEAVKVHNCHVLRGTGLARLFEQGLFTPPDLDGYLDRLVPFLEHLPASVEVHRLCGEARPASLLAPGFTARKSRALQLIRAALEERDVWQGSRAAAR